MKMNVEGRKEREKPKKRQLETIEGDTGLLVYTYMRDSVK